MTITTQTAGVDKAIDYFRKLPDLTRKAASRAVNETLKDVQSETGQKILPDAFTLRGRGKQWWEPGQKFGFNIRPFSKPETLEGTLGSGADWLRLQEHGGTKDPSDHRVAIPAPDYKSREAIMARAIKPRTILADYDKAARKLADAERALSSHRQARSLSRQEKARRHALKEDVRRARSEFKIADKARKAREGIGAQTGSKAFIATMKSGFTGIFKRLGKERFPLKLLFSLNDTAHLDPHLAWEDTAQKLASERYDGKFAREFLKLVK